MFLLQDDCLLGSLVVVVVVVADGMALVGDVSITTSSKLVNNLIPGDTDTADDSQHPTNGKERGEHEKEELTQELEALRTVS